MPGGIFYFWGGHVDKFHVSNLTNLLLKIIVEKESLLYIVVFIQIKEIWAESYCKLTN
jgi:lambda repressor-like predicted transcriptional regulator